jgi:hypothetical protein
LVLFFWFFRCIRTVVSLGLIPQCWGKYILITLPTVMWIMSLSRLANGNGHCVGTRHSVLYTFQVIFPFSLKYFFLGCMCFHYCSKYSLQIFRVLSVSLYVLQDSVLWSPCFSTISISSHEVWASSRLYFSLFSCVMAWNLVHCRELSFKNHSLLKVHCLEICHFMYFVSLVWGYFRK